MAVPVREYRALDDPPTLQPSRCRSAGIGLRELLESTLSQDLLRLLRRLHGAYHHRAPRRAALGISAHARDSAQWQRDLSRREQLDALGWRLIVVTVW